MKYEAHIAVLRRAHDIVAGAGHLSDKHFLCFAIPFAASDVFRKATQEFAWPHLKVAQDEICSQVHRGLQGCGTLESWVLGETYRLGIRLNLSQGAYSHAMQQIRMAWRDKMASEYEEKNHNE